MRNYVDAFHARMQERDPDLKLSVDRVFDVVLMEANVDSTRFAARELQVEIDLPVDMPTTASTGDPRVNYAMEHVFTLLSLVLDRDALVLSRRAVFSSDRNLRGTALEYLENVLPEAVRVALWPHLGESSGPVRERQSRGGDPLTDLRRALRMPTGESR